MDIGIYKIRNLKTNRFYIGASRNIAKRIENHLSKIKNLNHPNYLIQTDAENYGRESFSFEIVEYCNGKNIFEREKFYINTLQPQYNTLQKNNRKLKRLLLDIDADLHTEIRTTAAENGISIKKYVLRAVVNQMKKERTYEPLLRRSDMCSVQE